jgi:ATP synthase subunit 6
MIPDIFSSFDPISFIPIFHTQITLSISIIIIASLQLTFWSSFHRINYPNISLLTIIFQQLTRTFSVYFKRFSTSLSSLFLLLVFVNLLGLNPYSLRISSHLIFTLSFGLPLWISIILSSASYKPKAFIAHFLPDGAPTWLNPFLILIETVRIAVRPLTLSFRLAANIRAGHIVLGLVGLYIAVALRQTRALTIPLIIVAILYILFEVAICIIQAYIFCLLLSLYSDYHSH